MTTLYPIPGDADNGLLKPVEASALPVSDKPVTLNFKGGFGSKIALNTHPTGPVKKPLSLAFGEDDGADGNGDDDGGDQSVSEDPKGLSHVLRYDRVIERLCGLTCRSMQWLPRRRSRLWLQARRYDSLQTTTTMLSLIDNLQTANNITKWNQVQEELKDGGNPVSAAPVPTVVVRPV